MQSVSEDAPFTLIRSLADTAEQSCVDFLVGALKPFVQFADGAIRLSWPFLLTMLLVAYGCFLYQRPHGEGAGMRNFLKYLQFRNVWLHRSSLLDYRYLLLNGGLKAVLIAPLLISSVTVSHGILLLLTAISGPPVLATPTLPLLVAYSLCVVLAMDLGNYWSHRFHHEIPLLWQLHKVHHSAEVLNPVTALRIHPLESLMNAFFATTLSGVVMGVFAYFWNDVATAKLLGLNVILLFTNVVSGNLRHSHVWFSYGLVLEHVVSSPAQHQIHHSDNPIHFDKNYAVHFSLWDWVFGSLYTTTPRPEALNFGLGDEGRAFNSVIALWTRPLLDIAGRFRGRRTQSGQA
jgi:sterol desaturase/sphingolipid hydroxylase (fatty acid hydroxylase superfamily)